MLASKMFQQETFGERRMSDVCPTAFGQPSSLVTNRHTLANYANSLPLMNYKHKSFNSNTNQKYVEIISSDVSDAITVVYERQMFMTSKLTGK